jgi:hypothetical protein
MRRAIISIILMVSLIIVTSTSGYIPQMSSSSSSNLNPSPQDSKSLAEAGSNGNNIPVVQYMQRIITDQLLSVSNSYANPNTHSCVIDLSSYQIPGWTLYEVLIDVDNVTAAAEREVLGISKDINTFRIEEYNPANLWRYTSLAQGFYLQPHSGNLLNYSFYYDSPIYSPGTHGWAYYSVLSDYQNSSSNLVGYTQLPTRVLSVAGWENATVASTILDADTQYYVVINGSALIKTSLYPDIRWIAESGAGTFASQQYDNRFSLWGAYPCEALLNYTYIPWNTTANAALEYSNPSSIDLMVNGTPESGSAWVVSSIDNITSLEISTNQSVNVFHNLTLYYSHNLSANTVWKADMSASPIMWNATIDLAYPSVPETVFHFMNITNIPSDWNATNLYLGTSPAGSYARIGSIVYCSGLSDGTWTLALTAPNYVTDVALADSSDSLPIGNYVSILVDMTINATIEDGASTPITGGVANLTVLQAGTAVYAPAEVPVTSTGFSNFTWDISASTTGNGTHSIEIHWTNGSEAGYFAKQVFVYYPTSLIADETMIHAYTNNSFYIGIDFNQIFPVRGLDGSLSSVFYSIGTVVNASMDDQTSGRWDKTISTTGLSSGIYTLFIYAEGYALENHSLTIPVSLTFETRSLNCSWSLGNSITYRESTNLTVYYQQLNGTNIADAWVNVTFESKTYNLTWDAMREVYWIELYGENFTAVPGSFLLNISAWKADYTPQYNNTLSIDISNEPVADFSVTWNPGDQNITFIEQITIAVTYSYNSVPISGASVWIEFIGYDTVNMTFNPLSEQWEVTLDGSNYLGNTSLTVWASRTGYDTKNNATSLIVMEDIPSLTDSWTASSYTTDYVTGAPLTITIRDSIGSPISDANLTITVNSVVTTYAPGEYVITIIPPQTTGVYMVNVTMVRFGYTTTTIFLNLTVRATTEIVIITLSSEYEQWNLTVTVTYSDLLHSTPITGATVIITLDGKEYTLAYSAGSYGIEIVLDVAPGIYTLSVSATAPLANTASSSVELTVIPKRAVYLELVSEGNPSAEGQLVSLSATLRYNDTGAFVIGEDVYFVITITFVNGTVEVRDNPSQYDSTNTEGIAQWSFYVPAGSIASIEAVAHYDGSRMLWSAQRAITVGGTSPIMSLLNFFFGTDMGRIVIGSIFLVGIVAAAYNRGVKPKKRAAKTSLENQLQMFVDLESLRHFMAIYLDRGTCVFYHPFTDERIQPDLISGFIAAITSVYGEIKGDGVRGTLEEIQYHGLRLNSYSGDKIIGILILEGEMTPLLKDRLQFFVELFENQYETDLDGWTGLVDCFDPEWIVSTLNSAFNYSWLLPHRFGPTQKVSKMDAKILDYIAAVRDEKSEFYIRALLSPLSEMLDLSEGQVLDHLLTLQDKGAIVPVGVQTVLQRQGMGLSNGREGEEVTTFELPHVSEISEEPEKEHKPTKKRKTSPAPKVTEEATPEPEEELEQTPQEVPEEPTPEPEEKPIQTTEEVTEGPTPEPEPVKEIDPMEAFVMDVESLLTAKEKKESDTENDKED